MKKYYYKRNYYPSSTELGDIGFTYEILGTKPIRLCPYVFGGSPSFICFITSCFDNVTLAPNLTCVISVPFLQIAVIVFMFFI